MASLVWAKLILGRFRDAVLPGISRFPTGSDDYLIAFFTDPFMMLVDIPNGIRARHLFSIKLEIRLKT